jgi:hypothetical protein
MLGLESTSSRMGNLARQDLLFQALLHSGRNAGEHRSGHGRTSARDRARVLQSQEHHARRARQPGRLPHQTRGPRLLNIHPGKLARAGAPGRLVLCALTASLLFALDLKSLKPQGYVSDFANVLDPQSRAQLEAYCGQMEQATGVQMALVTSSRWTAIPSKMSPIRLFRNGASARRARTRGSCCSWPSRTIAIASK